MRMSAGSSVSLRDPLKDFMGEQGKLTTAAVILDEALQSREGKVTRAGGQERQSGGDESLLLCDAVESCEVLRESGGCELGGGLVEGFSDPESIGRSKDFSPKLKRVLVLLGAGLIIAGDILLRKSR